MSRRPQGVPGLRHEQHRCTLDGDWTLAAMRPRLLLLRAQLLRSRHCTEWDLSGVARIDSFGALLLWRSWGLSEPSSLTLAPGLRAVFERIRPMADLKPGRERRTRVGFVQRLGHGVIGIGQHVTGFADMLGQVIIEGLRLLVEPRNTPLREISATLYKAGVRAMPVAALVGFLIGVVLSFLFAMQLRTFGIESFIINILGIGVIRELGPVLVAILVAGRSGSAITAQLGVMRVTEELDALAAMGVSAHQRLLLPKALALGLAMPLLVLWTSAAALAGGMLSAQIQLGIDWRFFLSSLPHVVPLSNLYIGLVKGGVFGVAIALIACHFGMRIKPNTESLARNTTTSVVSAITAVLLLDAVFAMIVRTVGVPMR